eukprot:289272-Amphidinium_carterae.1
MHVNSEAPHSRKTLAFYSWLLKQTSRNPSPPRHRKPKKVPTLIHDIADRLNATHTNHSESASSKQTQWTS